MTLIIDKVDNPSEDEREAILEPLMAHNIAQVGDAGLEKFALLVRDDQSEQIHGGLYGKISGNWLFIELLGVSEQVRGQGIGSRLMAMAEDLARKKECVGIYLDTFDFQAPVFYQKLGFTQFGRLDDYPPGHQRYFFQKRLDHDGTGTHEDE
ncbi:GNAT family N-acetyltransferase [Pseudomonas fluorescens]|uniref:Acetyltransferase n=1 Tax=Pseudomonas fluorescens TaxID=294 RepID=A0A5E7DL89_PSEFL|nr:GNAT family N-acetyltransferase [Pseudomonas fluorescens]VVO08022.1 Acetyltransferase [Pseudomonas fluorescens]